MLKTAFESEKLWGLCPHVRHERRGNRKRKGQEVQKKKRDFISDLPIFPHPVAFLSSEARSAIEQTLRAR
jgi:hypothetical protein